MFRFVRVWFYEYHSFDTIFFSTKKINTIDQTHIHHCTCAQCPSQTKHIESENNKGPEWNEGKEERQP